jgi:hypothetical protein
MKSQEEAKLWKEYAEKTQLEYISFKSNSSDRALLAELESTRRELDHARSELGEQGELVANLMAEIGESA